MCERSYDGNCKCGNGSANMKEVDSKIMKTIQVLNNLYFIDEPEFREDDDFCMEYDADAYQDVRTRTICVPKGDEDGPYNREYRIDLLSHEIIHALFEAMGRMGEDGEVVVELIRFMSQWFLTHIEEVNECLE